MLTITPVAYSYIRFSTTEQRKGDRSGARPRRPRIGASGTRSGSMSPSPSRTWVSRPTWVNTERIPTAMPWLHS